MGAFKHLGIMTALVLCSGDPVMLIPPPDTTRSSAKEKAQETGKVVFHP